MQSFTTLCACAWGKVFGRVVVINKNIAKSGDLGT